MVNLLGNNVARRRLEPSVYYMRTASWQLFRLEDRSKLQTTYANLQFN
jgi:hypothetical protein